MELEKNIKSINGSQLTKNAYLSRINVLKKLCDTTIENICENPEKYIPMIKEKYKNPKTLKGYFTTILSLFKHTPELMVKHELYAKWLKAYMEFNKEVEDQVITNEPTERQQEGYVPFDEFKNKAKSLTGFDKLLVMMYSSIPPMRADFGSIAIYYDKLPSTHYANYMIIGKKGIKMVISQYKTAKTLGTIVEELPADLSKEIRASLKTMPRTFLFTDSYGKPFSDNGFVRFVTTRFKEIFNKPLTINILRHSFISSLDFNAMSIKDKIHIGKLMGHSYIQQDRYRLFFKKDDAENKN